jgi:hypothetical protein
MNSELLPFVPFSTWTYLVQFVKVPRPFAISIGSLVGVDTVKLPPVWVGAGSDNKRLTVLLGI